jgi:hypothetical protein
VVLWSKPRMRLRRCRMDPAPYSLNATQHVHIPFAGRNMAPFTCIYALEFPEDSGLVSPLGKSSAAHAWRLFITALAPSHS